MEVQVYEVNCNALWAETSIFTVWNNISGCENEGLLKELDRQQPPAASVHTPYLINTHVHTCTHPHMFSRQKVTLHSSSELQRSQNLQPTHLCQGSDDWQVRHPSPSFPPATTSNVPTSHPCMQLPYWRKKEGEMRYLVEMRKNGGKRGD